MKIKREETGDSFASFPLSESLEQAPAEAPLGIPVKSIKREGDEKRGLCSGGERVQDISRPKIRLLYLSFTRVFVAP